MQSTIILPVSVVIVARGSHTAVGNLIHILDAYWLAEPWNKGRTFRNYLTIYQSIEAWYTGIQWRYVIFGKSTLSFGELSLFRFIKSRCIVVCPIVTGTIYTISFETTVTGAVEWTRSVVALSICRAIVCVFFALVDIFLLINCIHWKSNASNHSICTNNCIGKHRGTERGTEVDRQKETDRWTGHR